MYLASGKALPARISGELLLTAAFIPDRRGKKGLTGGKGNFRKSKAR